MTSALNRLPNSTFELTLTVPWADVKRVYDLVFDELASQMEVEGFRKGKAPKDLAAAKLDKGHIYGEVVNRLLPDIYSQALSQHQLHPIASPQVKIVSGEEDKDWQFLAVSAEKPAVSLGDYKTQVAVLNTKGKIWTPGSDEQQPDKKQADEEKAQKISAIIEKLLEVSKLELPPILVESEVNRLLTQLIEDVRQAGLTYEQYLQSSGQTADQIKEKYKNQAETALKLEFILEAVAEDLQVKVDPQQLEELINKEADPQRKKALASESYLLSSVLRRENTIQKLLTL